jgi:hypothetical protein
LSIIKHVTLQKSVAHDFQYNPRIYLDHPRLSQRWLFWDIMPCSSPKLNRCFGENIWLSKVIRQHNENGFQSINTPQTKFYFLPLCRVLTREVNAVTELVQEQLRVSRKLEE